MNSCHACSPPRSRARSAAAAWVLGLATTASGLSGLAVGAAEPQEASPPVYSDRVHVIRGCYLSTVAYLARFERAYPREQARPLTVRPPNAPRAHTLVLLTWRGEWWARDEFAGVFPLGCLPSTAADTEAHLRSRAERALARMAQGRRDRWRNVEPPAHGLSRAAREEAVANAATMLPGPSTIVRVRCDGEETPFLFFTGPVGWVAVYDPVHGTGTAECASRDPALVVRRIAQRFGYRVEGGPMGPPKATATTRGRIAGGRGRAGAGAARASPAADSPRGSSTASLPSHREAGWHEKPAR